MTWPVGPGRPMPRWTSGKRRAVRACLKAVSLVVPGAVRGDWLEEWESELLHGWGSSGEGRPVGWREVSSVMVGVLRDGVQLRRVSGRRAPGRRLGSELKDDLSEAFRGLRRAPGLALFAIAVLSIGIGVNTAVIGQVRDALVGSLPFPDPDRLVQVWERRPAQGRDRNPASLPDFIDWRASSSSFDALAAVRHTLQNAAGGSAPEVLYGVRVTRDFFDVLGVAPAFGRVFSPSEFQPPGAPVVVIGDGLWTGMFGADPDVIGKTLRLDLVPHTIIGVMPPGVDFPLGVRYWTPLGDDPAQASRSSHGFDVFGRLMEGVSVDQARRDLDGVALRLEEGFPDSNTGHYTAVYPLRDELLGDVRSALLLLAGSVALVLLIVSANVANLQLVRSARRSHDMALRASLGATRARLVRLVLLENLLLALAGAGAGLVVAMGTRWALTRLVAARVPWTGGEGTSSLFVLLLVLLLAAVSALISGLVPAIQAARSDGSGRLGAGSSRAGLSRGARRWQGGLVVAQVSLAFLLVTTGGALARNMLELLDVDLGYDTEGLLTADVTLPEERYGSAEERLAFYRAVEERLAAIPGVGEAATAWILPMSDRNVGRNFLIDGRPPPSQGDDLNLRLRVVSPSYFRTMGIDIEGGRGFSGTDSEDGPLVAIASETLVARYWREEDPVGQRIAWGEGGEWITIVGVAEEVRQEGPEFPPQPELYLPLPQSPPAGGSFVVRFRGSHESVAGGLRAAVGAVDPDQPVSRVTRFEDTLASWLGRQRQLSRLIGVFALAALLLASMGVYGVVSYGVLLRTREFGIRLALGGEARSVLRQAMASGARMVAVGLVVGIAGTRASSRVVDRIVTEVPATDLGTVALALLLLSGVGLLAVFVPARRTIRIDPVSSLRAE